MTASSITQDPSPGGKGGQLGFPALFLVAANTVPLWGALFWGWQVFEVVVLYWLENVVVGLINLLKMALCLPDAERLELRQSLEGEARQRGADPALVEHAGRWLAAHGKQLEWLHHASKLFLMPFFLVHYGMFTLVHGMFVFFLLGPGKSGGASFGGDPTELMPELFGRLFGGAAAWGALALAASHLISFVHHFVLRGEFRRKTASQLMMAPYGRVVVLHLAILGGAFAIAALGSPLALLAILIAGKTLLDLGLHWRSHR